MSSLFLQRFGLIHEGGVYIPNLKDWVLTPKFDKAAICVVASREKLEAENQKMTQPLQIEDVFK